MKKHFDIHPNVFFPSLILILIFVGVAITGGESVRLFFEDMTHTITSNFGWLFVIGVNVFLIVCLVIGFGKFGKQRLGGKKATPDFTLTSWFAMLFSAGMGIGLMYFSVSEPITHYALPPIAVEGTTAKAMQALNFTYLHYGVHAWAIYSIVGLSLAFFAFNKGLPFSLRSIFFPLLGRKIFGWRGDLIDIIAVLATLFGLATSLGLGARQIASGLKYIFGIDSGLVTQISIIVIITLIATISVVTGLKKGVKILSRINLFVALIFLVSMFLLSDSVGLLKMFVQSTGNYFQNLLQTGTYSSALVSDEWQGNWTVFYWSWWIAWSPFVGMFIARISKGRTLREFIFGVLLVPSLMTFLWMTVFGGSALNLEIETPGLLSTAILEDSSTSLFMLLHEYPLASITSFIGIFMVSIFFITSSDSGSLVIDSITSGGKLDAPVGQRIMWALTEGLVATALLIGGGLKAMQAASVSSGILFLLVLLLMCWSLLKSLKRVRKRRIKKHKVKNPNAWIE